MVIFNLPLDLIQLFTFVLVRVAAIVFTIPFLSSHNVPVLVKAGLAVAVSVLIIPRLSIDVPLFINSPFGLIFGLLGEIAIGITIGLAFHLVVVGVLLAGQLAGFQMGIAIANVMDPASSLQIPVLSQFLNLFAMMLFMAMNAHFYFVQVLADAFNLIPPLGVNIDNGLFDVIMQLVSNAFVLGIKIAAPVTVALLLSNVALGLVARTVPQMQIFIVSMPLKILVGFLFFGISLPYCASHLYDVFDEFGRTLFSIIRLF